MIRASCWERRTRFLTADSENADGISRTPDYTKETQYAIKGRPKTGQLFFCEQVW